MLRKQKLDPVPCLPINDRIVKTIMALVGQPPNVDRVRQDLVEMAPADQPTAYDLARPVNPEWQPGVVLVEKCLEPHDAADLEIAPIEIAHEHGMLLDNMERPVLDPIAEGNHASHPDALPLRGGDLVPDPLASDLALKLGEGEEHIQGQSSHAGRRVERLG